MAGQRDQPEEIRAHELELWDRVLKRWDEHSGRQLRIGIGIFSFVVALIAFLGLRTVDKTVEDSVRTGVEATLNKVTAGFEQQTKSLSEQINKELIEMMFAVRQLEQQSQTAEELLSRMEASKKRFEGLEDELRERIVTIDQRVDAIETDIAQRLNAVKTEVDRVDRIAASLAVNTTPAQDEDKTQLAAAREKPSPQELGADALNALGIRQVPIALAQASTQYARPSYLLTFSAFVDESVPAATARRLLNSVDKVIYTLSERWFSPNVIERTNRSDNFQFAVTVWGRTPVKAKVEFVKSASPICWMGLINLEQTVNFDRVSCKNSSAVLPGGPR